MCDDELKLFLTSAVTETEEDKEEEKKATATFVSANPDNYDDEGNHYEDEYDEDEDEDEEDLMYIEGPEYHIISEGLQATNEYIQRITELLTLPREQQPQLSIIDFLDLMQAIQALRHETYPTRNLTCNYQ